MRKFCFIIAWSLILWGCAKKPVKIGVVLPLSGSISSYGEMCLKGVELAARLVNEKGGINGRQVEVLVENDKGEVEEARASIERLDKEGVVAIIGPLTTKVTAEVGEYADKLNLPLITPTATGIEATKDRNWVWRVSFTDPFQAKILAKFAVQQLKLTSACALIDSTDPYSLGLYDSFEDEFTDRGGNILFIGRFSAGDTTFKEQLTAIKKCNPGCVFVPALYKESKLIVRQARAMGLTQPFIGGDGWDAPEFFDYVKGTPGANYYSTSFFHDYSAGAEEMQQFLHAFRDEYGKEPPTFSALGYDAFTVIEKCFELSGKVGRNEFKDNISKLSFTGVSGIMDFTASKDPKRSLIILKLESDTLTGEMIKF